MCGCPGLASTEAIQIAVPNIIAVLLIGPPRSDAIMAPIIAPIRIAPEVPIFLSNHIRPLFIPTTIGAMIGANAYLDIRPVIITVTSGTIIS